MSGCGQCADGWVCEDHPELPQGHDDCGGAGMPCENQACRFSIVKTGLVCPACRQAMGTIETETHRLVVFKCKACEYRWHAEQNRVFQRAEQAPVRALGLLTIRSLRQRRNVPDDDSGALVRGPDVAARLAAVVVDVRMFGRRIQDARG